MTSLHPPFVYFGGKARIAQRIWELLGDVPNFVDPFCGSNAVLLARPDYDSARHLETVNDAHGFISNFFRALQADPATVAHYADWPANENDLHARHAWLVGRKDSLQARLEGDPAYYDAQVAGWWCWGMALWIGGEFCTGHGPWRVVDGRLVRQPEGQGVQRRRVHLRNAGVGVQRRRVHLGDAGQGEEGLYAWFQALADRLRRVRVCCGDWSRVLGPAVTVTHGLTGIFLDPPYSAEADRDNAIYAHEDLDVAHAVRAWCLAYGHHPQLRIVLCGYGEEHDALLAEGWQKEHWSANGGYGLLGNRRGRANRHREALWYSPSCVRHHRNTQPLLPFLQAPADAVS